MITSRLGVNASTELKVELAASFVEVIGPAEMIIGGLDDPVTDAGWWGGDVEILAGEVVKQR